MSRDLTSLDLFCGAGGLSEGFAHSGFRCLYGNDFSSVALTTFSANRSQAVVDDRPIETIEDESRIRRQLGLRRGELDVLIGGPPCQGFSINAPSRFLDDPRNALFVHYLRFVEEFQPKALAFENVPGILSLGRGEIVERVKDELERRGYSVSLKVLLAAHYGVPQERWRLVILAGRGPEAPTHPRPTHFASCRANFRGGRDLVFRLSEEEAQDIPRTPTVKEAIGDLPRLRVGEGEEVSSYDRPPTSEYARAMREESVALYNHVAGRLSIQNLERLKHIKPGGSWRDIPFDLLPAGMKRARRSDHTKRYGRLRPDGLASTIMTKCDPHWGPVFLPDQERALTVREAARLQSFPDRFRFLGSRVEQYRQVGNAVPVLMGRAIATALLDYIESLP